MSASNGPEAISRGRTGFPLLSDAYFELSHRPTGNVPALDFFRTIAVVLVFAGHAFGALAMPAWTKYLLISHYGWTGVDLFFVLSGFLIGSQLWSELKRTNTVDVGKFFLMRGFRIWPLYYAFAAYIFVRAFFTGQPLPGFWTDLLYLSNYNHTYIGGSWSLSSEEQFYLFLPAILFLGVKLLPARYLLVLPILWLLALPLSRAYSSMDQQGIYYAFHTHSDGLPAGVILAWIRVFRPQWLSSLGFFRNLLEPVLIVATCGFLYRWNQVWFNFTALGGIYTAAILFALRQTSSSSPATPWLQWRIWYWISRLSYGIYLNHFGLLHHLQEPLRNWAGDSLVAKVAALLLLWSTTMAIAFITYAIIELPFLRMRNRWHHSSKAAS
jgi:peptidoglycan/LPS O-acetylase OafA/YrhL